MRCCVLIVNHSGLFAQASPIPLNGSQDLEISVDFVSRNEGQHIRLQCSEVRILEDLDCGVFDRPVHMLNVAIGTRVVHMDQSMFDGLLMGDAIKKCTHRTCWSRRCDTRAAR